LKPILVINSGSSSLKYQVIDVDSDQSLLSGTIERVESHEAAFSKMLEKLQESQIAPVALAHRVVHGGDRFAEPVVITAEVEKTIEDLIPLAPLHNPGNLAGIRAGERAFPNLKQVAVFDTAFHQSMPEGSYRYAIDLSLAKRLGVRKYGFHGTSHSYVSRKAAAFLGIEPASFNAVVLHLGNGASVCAVKNGKSFDTSMGLTPLAGLVMGSRSGDIDPAVIFYLIREGKLSVEQVDELLNKKSGLLGLSGVSDFRDLDAKSNSGDQAAQLAIKVFVERARQYLGGYVARLGKVDAIIFTGGIGENNAGVRQLICADLEAFGISLATSSNQEQSKQTRKISDGTIAVLVVPTNEELEIATQAARLI
jgi:acetate kinase